MEIKSEQNSKLNKNSKPDFFLKIDILLIPEKGEYKKETEKKKQ
jgi:hypothetical protein